MDLDHIVEMVERMECVTRALKDAGVLMGLHAVAVRIHQGVCQQTVKDVLLATSGPKPQSDAF